jgi:two-component system nitrogen regulation response regulator GlnG
MMMKKILVIDDDESIQWVIKKALEPLGYEIESKNSIKEAEKLIDKYNLFLLDLMLPDGSGLDLLKKIRESYPDSIVIIITAHGKMESAINAMKEGAYDYIEKPFDIEELKILIQRAYKDLSIREELLRLRQSRDEYEPFQMIGNSKAMLKVFKEIGKVSAKDVTVLISGESGTGKELVARAIHNNSKRKYGFFVAINSASIPKDLLEAELFGWEKGAFTGATERRAGKIQAAEGGTLFLDEIAELDMGLQAKLLRFLQEKEYSPLGSTKTLKADVRIIGATNRNLKEQVDKGLFREDLFYRFNVIEIKLPPLRERREDIIPLAKYFLKKAVSDFELLPKELSKEAERALQNYDWPGNVRELENTIKRAVILSKNSIIEKKDIFTGDLSFCTIKDFLETKLNKYIDKMTTMEDSNLYETVISEVEKALFSITLKKTEGNQIKASKILGINRNTLSKKIKQYKLI